MWLSTLFPVRLVVSSQEHESKMLETRLLTQRLKLQHLKLVMAVAEWGSGWKPGRRGLRSNAATS